MPERASAVSRKVLLGIVPVLIPAPPTSRSFSTSATRLPKIPAVFAPLDAGRPAADDDEIEGVVRHGFSECGHEEHSDNCKNEYLDAAAARTYKLWFFRLFETSSSSARIGTPTHAQHVPNRHPRNRAATSSVKAMLVQPSMVM